MATVTTPIKSRLTSEDFRRGSAKDKENVAQGERWLSLVGGGLLTVYGLRQRDWPGFGLALLGGALLERGLTGHCRVYKALDVSTKKHGRAAAVGAGRGMKVSRSVTIQKSPEELYRFWHDFDNLPR